MWTITHNLPPPRCSLTTHIFRNTNINLRCAELARNVPPRPNSGINVARTGLQYFRRLARAKALTSANLATYPDAGMCIDLSRDTVSSQGSAASTNCDSPRLRCCARRSMLQYIIKDTTNSCVAQDFAARVVQLDGPTVQSSQISTKLSESSCTASQPPSR